MTKQFDKVTFKIWFQNQSVSRNIYNVVEVTTTPEAVWITQANGKTIMLVMQNVNMMEDV